MESEENNLCCGCLSAGRKMILQVEYWKKLTFSQIINEITLSQGDSVPVWLCWECSAQLDHFTKFKTKVRTSYAMFLDFIRQNRNLPNLTPTPKLTKHDIFNFDLQNTSHKPFQVIPTHNTEIPIKEEFSVCSEDNNSDDEKLIIYKSNKTKNDRIKKKRRKKKKMEAFREVELSPDELLKERKDAMLKEEYANAMFRCEKCILSFPNAEDLKDHFHMKHDLHSANYKCHICECSFASEVSFNYHTNKHIRRYECSVCTERCVSKRAIAKHYELVHYNGPSIGIDVQDTQIEVNTQNQEKDLPNDQNELSKDNADVTDESTKQTPALFVCDTCDKRFKWKASLRKHVEVHRIETGQKRKPYCETCRLSFTTTANLQKHVKTSTNHQIQLKLRKLTEALPDSSNAEKRQQHIEQIKCSVLGSRQKFPCPQCDKKFLCRGNLLRHVHSHVARANGNLVCKPCNRTFSSIATYKQHMSISRKHVSENDFKYMCSDCGKRFPNKTQLKDHVDWEHLKNFVHICSVCQKVLKSKTSLYLHKQVVHKTENTEHLCDHCGKSFANQSKLRSHVLALHSAQAAYKCNICGARFSWLSCLSRHTKKLHPQLNKT